mmetsp:Transcript_67292/g.170678  ORF Transcript_67292/g.170678 Transcript_67292/m.170678 type:complete len:200 (+) Transcript_67292:196-795(+)
MQMSIHDRPARGGEIIFKSQMAHQTTSLRDRLGAMRSPRGRKLDLNLVSCRVRHGDLLQRGRTVPANLSHFITSNPMSSPLPTRGIIFATLMSRLLVQERKAGQGRYVQALDLTDGQPFPYRHLRAAPLQLPLGLRSWPSKRRHCVDDVEALPEAGAHDIGPNRHLPLLTDLCRGCRRHIADLCCCGSVLCNFREKRCL